MMEYLNLQLLYGSEFWQKLDYLVSSAENRVFFISAFMKKDTYLRYKSRVPDDTFYFTMTRNERSNYIPDNALTINKDYFHGKLYLIDDKIIIGSQNLTDYGKEGEFNILIDTDDFTASLIAYQAMIKTIEELDIPIEPVNDGFLRFYEEECPFCGGLPTDPAAVHKCHPYGGFVSEGDCYAYGDTGFCSYCFKDEYDKDESYFCDDTGCGIGIKIEDMSLIEHAINPPGEAGIDRAKDFIKLFNFISDKLEIEKTIRFFENLGFIGKVYEIKQERPKLSYLNTTFLKDIIDDIENRIKS